MKQLLTSFLLIFCSIFLSSSFCSKKPLSPARAIEGTWRTNLTAPYFYYYSDVCGSYVRVSKTQIGLQMVVTRLTDNTVDVTITRTNSSAVQLLVSQPCALYVPIAFPKFLTGQVSSSRLDLYESNRQLAASFGIITDNMTGEFNSNFDKYCGGFCSGAGTDSRAVVLVK